MEYQVTDFSMFPCCCIFMFSYCLLLVWCKSICVTQLFVCFLLLLSLGGALVFFVLTLPLIAEANEGRSNYNDKRLLFVLFFYFFNLTAFGLCLLDLQLQVKAAVLKQYCLLIVFQLGKTMTGAALWLDSDNFKLILPFIPCSCAFPCF